MANNKFRVAAFDFKYAKHFAPFPQDPKDQEYYFFKVGDKLPEDVADRIEQRGSTMMRWATEAEAKELKKKDEESREEAKPFVPLKKTLKDYPQERVDELFALKKAQQVTKLEKHITDNNIIRSLNTETKRVLEILRLEG